MDSILLVDDNAMARAMTRDMLAEGGHVVVEADCAQGARERMAEHAHNVVLLDVVLPDTNGIDLLKEFVRAYPSSRVVIMTAHTSTDLAVRAIERGAYDFVSKPLRKEELLITVRKALDNFWLSHQRDVLIEKLNRKIERLELFEGISKIISTTLDLEHLLDLSVRITRNLVPADLYRFVLTDASDKPGPTYTFRETEEGLRATDETLGQSAALEVLCGGHLAGEGEGALPAALTVPMRLRGRVLGILQVLKFRGAPFGCEEEELLTLLSSHLATAIHNATLTAELRASKKQVESYSRNLEKMVGDRTVELEEANRDLLATNRRLEKTQDQLLLGEKMASLGQLAAGVAHEINNPLAFISSNLHTLGEHLEEFHAMMDGVSSARLPSPVFLDQVRDDFQDAREILQDCQEGTRRMEKIVVSLRDFCSADRERPVEADLNAEVDKALKLVWNEMKYKAEVEVDLGDIPPISCYPGQLGQVLINLLVNASQALEGEGKIGVSTRLEGEEVVIRVSDTGPGIPKEIRERIFDPFFTTKEVGQGTGLGLSVSYGIVQRHNGRIEVDSWDGKGTTFSVRLPAAGVGPPRREAEGRGGKRTVGRPSERRASLQ